MLGLDEGQPVNFAHSVIVVVLSVSHGCSTVALDQTVDEIFGIVFFKPVHLLQEALQKALFKEGVILDVIRYIID